MNAQGDARLRRTYDVIVVGSGPGGATAARELARRGQQVLLLERGQQRPVTGSVREALRDLWSPGRGLLPVRGPLTLLRGITLGGSSVFYYGTAWEPPFAALDEHGLDLRTQVDAIRREIPLLAPDERNYGPRARISHDAARSLGLAWGPLTKFLDPARFDGPVPAGHSVTDHPAKWTARAFVDDAVEHGADLLTRAAVRGVLVRDGAAVGVRFRHRGRTRYAHARQVVVAAGATATPQILRRSGITGAGRDFFYDPLLAVYGEVPGLDADDELPMMGGLNLPEDGIMLADMTLPAWLTGMATAMVGHPVGPDAARRTVTLMVKVRDELSGHIGRLGGVHRPPTARDRGRLETGARLAERVLAAAGATRVYRTALTAVHPGGTAKVGDVVDSELETAVRGLYVADASVIPIPWGVPPTMTVIAIGKRVAARIAGERPGPARTTRRTRVATHPDIEAQTRTQIKETKMQTTLSPWTIAARAIAGSARIDDRGNRMDPGTQTVLRVMNALPLPRPWQMEPEAARAAFERQVRLLDSVRPDVAEIRNMVTDGMDTPVPLRVYRPRADGPLPVLVWLHGGGLVVGSLDSYDGLFRRLAIGIDAIVVAVDYRLAPEHKFPGPLEDSLVAFRWVAANAAALGGDPARVAVGGDSGGGGLAAAVAHRARDDADGPQPFAQVLVYPSVDATGAAASHRLFAENAYPDHRLKRWYLAHHLRHSDDALHPDASPLRSPRFDGLPAAVVAIAGFDPMRDEGEQYAARLREAGVEVTEVDEPHLVHGYLSTPRLRAARVAGRRLAAAATQVLHRSTTASGHNAGAGRSADGLAPATTLGAGTTAT